MDLVNKTDFDVQETFEERVANMTSVGCIGGANASNYCAEGLRGPLCELCVDTAQYYDHDSLRCEDCPAATGTVLAVLIPLICIALLGQTLYALGLHRLVIRIVSRVQLFLNAIGFRAIFKLAVGFYQVLVAMEGTTGVRMPRDFVRFLKWFELFAFDIGISFVPMSCIGSAWTVKALQLLSPLGAMLVALLLHLTKSVVQEYRAWIAYSKATDGVHTCSRWITSGLKAGLAAAMPNVLLLTYVCLVPATKAVVQCFMCTSFHVNTELVNRGHVDREAIAHFMSVDMTIPCPNKGASRASHDVRYRDLISMGSIMFLIWPIGMPLLYMVLLHQARSSIRASRPTRASRAISFLHGEYKPAFFYWELLETLRRLLLVGALYYISKDELPISRLVTAAAVSLGFLFAVLWLRPHRRVMDSVLAALVHFALALVFFSLCMVEFYQRTMLALPGHLGKVAAERILGMSSPRSFGLVLISIVVVTYSMMTAEVVGAILLTRVPHTIHDKATHAPVTLSLEKQHKFHLFLSHLWGSGQDQVAAIKRQLCLLVPGISIFLDVDDLQEISALERYVSEAAVVLVFLSKGYFRSRNCLREVVASLKQQKPIVLVWEPEPNKGGSTIEALKGELHDRRAMLAELGSTPEECEQYIFVTSQADGRPTIPWHRITNFQLKTLTMIAQQTLIFSPAYRMKQGTTAEDSSRLDEDVLALYIPGEINPSRMVVKPPVVLYVSPLNPGAAEAAEELREAVHGVRITHKPPPGCGGPEPVAPALLEDSTCPRSASPRKSRRSSARTGSKSSREGTRPLAEGDLEATHFLLYLSSRTFIGVDGLRFEEQVRAFRERGMPYLMIHENDPERHGCEFDHFFSTTPQDLIDNGIYGALAVAFFAGPHRQHATAQLHDEAAEGGDVHRAESCFRAER